jgi:hypothetical protein
VQQTLLILKQLRANQQLSTLLQIGLSWFQLHAGITQQILECPTIEVPYLEIGWFRSLRQFLCSIQAELHVELNHIAQPLRRHDNTIMNALLSLQTIAPNRLYRINLCRLYLQAYLKYATLSGLKYYKKSGMDIDLQTHKRRYCGRINPDPMRNPGQNGEQSSKTHSLPQISYVPTKQEPL